MRVRAVLDVYGDFAQVRSYAVGKFFAQQGFDQALSQARASQDAATQLLAEHGQVLGTKSTLELDDSYYAAGVTAAGKVLLEYRGAELGATVARDSFVSIDSRDRNPNLKPGRNYALADQRLLGSAWIGFKLPRTEARIRLKLEEALRTGQLETIRVSDTNRRAMLTLFWGF